MASAKTSSRDVILVDGSLDFSGGVNSYVTTTIQSDRNPNGLRRNQVSWMDNCTVRGGGITQRTGWLDNGVVNCTLGQYQGSFMYSPIDDSYPYFIASIGGNIYQIDPDNPQNAVNLSVQFGLTNPVNTEIAYFEQAEQFLILQAGDYATLPLFWDGTTLRRSNGIISAQNVPTNVGGPYAVVDALTSTAFTIPAVGANTIALNFSAPVPANGSTVYFYDDIYTGGSKTPDANGHYNNLSSAYTQFTIFSGGTTAGPVVLTVAANTSAISRQGANLSAGFSLTSVTTPGGAGSTPAPTNELPAAGPMIYYMGRLWYAQGRVYCAGDIVGGPSGTLPGKADSVLKVTENPLAVGGDGFTVPAGSGNIRALSYLANTNASAGQGQLVIFTRSEVFALTVPVTRTDWTYASTSNMPLQTVLQNGNGAVNQRSVVAVNGDLFFQSFEPSIRSLITAVRYFDQWGNTPISINENRILAFNNRSFMRFSSGILFDNRVLQCVLPYACPVGVAHQAIIPLNFDVISTLDTKLPPVWEGMYEGLNILEVHTGDFGGLPRAFGFTWSDVDQSIHISELTDYSRFDQDDNRVEWYVEFPAFTWGNELEQKKLVSAELWFDKILGTVYYQMDYRVNGNPCWFPWYKWQICSAKNTNETVANPTPYPTDLRESFRQTVDLPKPPIVCEPVMGQTSYIGYQFQPRLTIKGWCRIRGVMLKAEPWEKSLYGNIVCLPPIADTVSSPSPSTPAPPPPGPALKNDPPPVANQCQLYDWTAIMPGAASIDFVPPPCGLTQVDEMGHLVGYPAVRGDQPMVIVATDAQGNTSTTTRVFHVNSDGTSVARCVDDLGQWTQFRNQNAFSSPVIVSGLPVIGNKNKIPIGRPDPTNGSLITIGAIVPAPNSSGTFRYAWQNTLGRCAIIPSYPVNVRALCIFNSGSEPNIQQNIIIQIAGTTIYDGSAGVNSGFDVTVTVPSLDFTPTPNNCLIDLQINGLGTGPTQSVDCTLYIFMTPACPP